MNEPKLVPLEKIQPNPFQPRGEEDPAVVAEIAVDIFRHGLLQIPHARQVNGQYELVFGHTRRAAYQLLATSGVPASEIEPDARYASMPLYIYEMDDRQMFELSVAENIKRRDLDPIEQARAMQRYMDEFQASSEQAAELFGVRAATVRGKVRLLDLPENVQAMVASGELSERASRQVLTLQRAAPEKVAEVAEKLSASGADPDVIVSNTLRYGQGTVELWEKWRDQDAPLAGAGNWPIGLGQDQFPMERLPEFTAKQAKKLFGEAFDETFHTALDYDPTPENAEALIKSGADAGMVERTLHLMRPPACSACPFYVRHDSTHYCTFGECHKRKVAAWAQVELQRLVEALGIPAYERVADGKKVHPLGDWNRRREEEEAFEARHADLRLRAKKSSQYNSNDFTKSYHVQAVWVGESAREIAAKKKDESGETWEQRNARRERERQRKDAIKQAVKLFIWEGLAPFETMLPVANLPFLEALAGRLWGLPVEAPPESAPAKEKAAYCRRGVLFELLWVAVTDQGLDEQEPVQSAARHLQGVAKSWGVPLPADWLDQARAAEYVDVAAETEPA